MKKQTKNKTCIPFGNTAKAFAQNFLLILTALVLGFFPYRAFAQNPDFLFAKGIGGGAGGSDEGKSIAVDPDGNMYVTGYFAGLVDFDPSASAALRFSTGGNDLFLAKYNASGNFVWAYAIGGSGSEQGNDVAVDESGNVYVTGFFGGTVDFDPSGATANLVSVGSNEAFIAKYSSSGAYLWAKAMGGTGLDLGISIAVEANGNVHVTGTFNGTADFDPSGATANLVSSGFTDIFIAKYDGSGNYLWAKAIGGTSSDVVNSLAVDGSGNVHIAGNLTGTIDFDPSGAIANLNSVGGSDIFIAKYDSAGNYVWAKAMGGTNNELGSGIALDASGNVYITGSFNTTADFDPSAAVANLVSAGLTDTYFAKYDSSGAYVWAFRVGNTSIDSGNSIAVDDAGNVNLIGNFWDTIDFNPGAGVANVSVSGSQGIFIAKYNTSGAYIWAKGLGGSSGNENGNAIALDGSGNVHITGYLQGSGDFDPSGVVVNLSSINDVSAFAGKYTSAAGNYVYAFAVADGNGGSEDGKSIVLDASGNIFVTGVFAGLVDFDPSGASAVLSSAGGYDIYIAKYNSLGNYVWAKSMGGTNNDWGLSLTLDGSGNVLVTGYFMGTADFDPSGATANLTGAGGSQDAFIAKYDASGNYVWAKGIGGTSADQSNSIAVDGSGNVHITGTFLGTADFDPSAATANLVSVGSNDIFIAKYNSSGVYVWAKAMGSPGASSADVGNSIALDASGNVHITGYFLGTADFDPSGAVASLVTAGNTDIFIAKYNSSGAYVWAKRLGGTSSDLGYSIALDGSGNIQVTGSFNGTADFDPSAAVVNLVSAGSTDVFIGKYDVAGAYLWANRMGGTAADIGIAVALDGTGNAYITGSFNGTADFDPSAAVANLVSAGNTDIFIGKYNTSGNYVWAKGMGGTSADKGNAYALDACGYTHITGSFMLTADFDHSAGTANLTSIGAQDFFIAQYGGCIPPSFLVSPLGNVPAFTDPGLCTAVVSYTVTVSGCPAPALTYLFTGATSGSGNGTGAGYTFNKGVTSVTLTATNACGAPTVSFTVTVTDNHAPVISNCAVVRNINGCNVGAITGPAYSTMPAASSYAEFSNVVNMGLASDNCAITSVTYQDAAAGTCPIVVTRTWTVTDEAGFMATCNQTINVNAPPVTLTCPLNVTEAAGQDQATIDAAFEAWLLTVSYSGGCNASISNTNTGAPQACGGSTTVIWTVESDCEADVMCSAIFEVLVTNIPVTISGPSAVCSGSDAILDAGPGYATYGWSHGGGSSQTATFPNMTMATTFTVSVTDANNCTGFDTHTVNVNPLPVVTCPGNSAMCIDAGAFALTGGSPMGGTYSGPAEAGMLNPGRPGAGTGIIRQPHGTYTDGNNCTAFCTFSITVNPLPVVTCPMYSPVCIDASAFALAGGSPMGGTYSGPGVNAGMFNPSAAGAGAHAITYTYTDGNNCTASCTFTITVNPLPVVTCPIAQLHRRGALPGGGRAGERGDVRRWAPSVHQGTTAALLSIR
ncbi:MAG: SBBP repeat-containing protein [Saprospirales bacterium]|nr:SBBP repeat-containing protein [Saprospirales bacterium]